MTQNEFFNRCIVAAVMAGQVWPRYASCEAALESDFGNSQLAIEDNNILGVKQHVHPVYGTAVFHTKEFLDGHWKVIDGSFVKYPSWTECFKDRMDTLRRLAPYYPHYANALKAQTGQEFVEEVSKSWSTDPNRAQKVLDIFNARYTVDDKGQTHRNLMSPIAPPAFNPTLPVPEELK